MTDESVNAQTCNKCPSCNPAIETVAVLTLKPGDLLVVYCAHPLTQETMRRVKEGVDGWLAANGWTGVSVAVFDKGLRLGVVRAEAAGDGMKQIW